MWRTLRPLLICAVACQALTMTAIMTSGEKLLIAWTPALRWPDMTREPPIPVALEVAHVEHDKLRPRGDQVAPPVQELLRLDLRLGYLGTHSPPCGGIRSPAPAFRRILRVQTEVPVDPRARPETSSVLGSHHRSTAAAVSASGRGELIEAATCDGCDVDALIDCSLPFV